MVKLMSRLGSSLCLLLAMGACAHSGDPAVADDHLSFKEYGHTPRTVLLSSEGMVDPRVNVGFYDGEVRGLFHGRTVDLEASGSAITGRSRGWTHLSVTPGDHAVSASGEFDGRPAHLRLTPGQFRGSITGCQFDLHSGDGNYQGNDTCLDWPVTVHFPEALWSLPPTTQAVAIAAFLAS